MNEAVASTAGPDPIQYLDAAAGSAVGRDYKGRLADALDLRRGQRVLDIGCGPGTDLGRLADEAGGHGRVIGVDREPGMISEARRRHWNRPVIGLLVGDVHQLPLDYAQVDRARFDRVLQHVRDPAQALREVRRVIRPGGILAMAEPDWDTLAVADDDVETSRGFARYVASRVRNATVGRQLVRLASQAGFVVRSVDATSVVFRDFGTADVILGLRRNTARAVAAGVLPAARAGEWLDRIADGHFLAGFTFYLVTAQAVD